MKTNSILSLNDEVLLGDKKIANRIVFQPMEGCDCHSDGSPSELTKAKYMSFAGSGAGIIWFEANAVCEEGKTNARQMMLTKENAPAFRELVSSVKKCALKNGGAMPLLFLQLTHSGRQSISPMIAYRHPIYEKTRPAGDENTVTDDYLDSLAEKFAYSARLAFEVGFDGVDVKSCHGYLMQELLSAFTRSGRYGGSFENRISLYINCIKAVKASVPCGFSVVTRLGISDLVPRPYGFGTDENNNVDLTEPKKLIEILCGLGIQMINVTLGNPYFNPHVNRPFRAGGYIPCEKPEVGLMRFESVESSLKKAFPDVLFVGSGLSYYRKNLMQTAERLISGGVCDLVGFGRITLSYPQFYKDYLSGSFDAKKTCAACSKCTALMRQGAVSGCAVYNEYYKNLYKEKVLCKK